MTEAEYRKHMEPKVEAIKTEADLIAILDQINYYNHDYGTIVIGVSMAMMAAMKYVNRNAQHGGITGFQASCVAWELIQKLMMIKLPCKIVDYNHMLYPQYRPKFEKTISQEIFDHLKTEAARFLVETENADASVKLHWEKIKAGNIPFDYEIAED